MFDFSHNAFDLLLKSKCYIEHNTSLIFKVLRNLFIFYDVMDKMLFWYLENLYLR